MGELSPWHWLLVIVVAALLFGAKRLPDAARSIGRSTRILKSELRADDNASTSAEDDLQARKVATDQPTQMVTPVQVSEPAPAQQSAPQTSS